MKRLIAIAIAAVIVAMTLAGCTDTECAGHGGWYALSHGIFYCNDGTLDYG